VNTKSYCSDVSPFFVEIYFGLDISMKAKLKTGLFCVLVSLLACGPALADSDDVKWVAQCLKDNKDEGAKLEVVTKYCTCMNNKMGADETRTITVWEKANPQARKACEKEAGWK